MPDYRNQNDDSVRLAVRRLMAVGFAPLNRVRTVFTEIELRSPHRLQPLFQYFRNQWLAPGGLQMWNVHGVDLGTDNHVEGWHRRFNSVVNKHHPNLWHFMTQLIIEQAASDAIVQQIAAGQQVQATCAKFKQLNARIKRLHQRYVAGRLTVMQLVTGVGHNLHQF